MRRGLFVSIEGGEGAGKSVQAKALAAHLEKRGERVRLVREPGGTDLGERVREVLLFDRTLGLAPEAEALLFSAARAQLTVEVVRPSLDEHTHVVADRYFDSTLAYQGYGRGARIETLRAVTRFAVGDTVPDLTFLLDLPVDLALARTRERSKQWDRFEAQDEGFHTRVRNGYLALAKSEPARWVVLDGTLSEEQIVRLVTARVDQELSRHSNRIPAR